MKLWRNGTETRRENEDDIDPNAREGAIRGYRVGARPEGWARSGSKRICVLENCRKGGRRYAPDAA